MPGVEPLGRPHAVLRVLMWLGLALLTSAPTCFSTTLTVMSYNVLHGQPCAGGSQSREVTPRMELAVQGGPAGERGLAALEPDILGMQEVSQIYVDQTVAENQACSTLAALPPPAGGVPPGVTEVAAFEHAGDTLVRRMNGVITARTAERHLLRMLRFASPYAMRFVRDNPRILPLLPDVALPPDEESASDVASELADLEVGLAVISRFGIQRPTVHNLPPDERPGGTRALMHASIADGDTRFDFFDSHLTTGGGDTVPTQVEAQDIVAFIQQNRRHPENPGFFVCDCNATPDTPAYAAFVAAGFLDTFAVANPGASGFTGGRDGLSSDCTQAANERIDYVWALPDDQGRTFAVLSSEVVMDYSVELSPGVCRFPSDHNGVITRFDRYDLR